MTHASEEAAKSVGQVFETVFSEWLKRRDLDFQMLLGAQLHSMQ